MKIKRKYIPKHYMALMCMSFQQETKTYDELIRMTHKELSVRLTILIFSYRSAVEGIRFNYNPYTQEIIIGSHAQKILRSLCDIKPENEPII